MPLHYHRRLGKRWNEVPRNDGTGKEFSNVLGDGSDGTDMLERRPSARRFVKSIWNTVTNSPDRSSQPGDASRFNSGGAEQEVGTSGGGVGAVSGPTGLPPAPNNNNGGSNQQDEKENDKDEEAVETEETLQLSKPELSAEVGVLRVEVERQELLMERQQLVKKLEAMKREAAAAAAAASINDAATATATTKTTAEGSLLQQKEELTSNLVRSLLSEVCCEKRVAVVFIAVLSVSLTSDDAPPLTIACFNNHQETLKTCDEFIDTILAMAEKRWDRETA
jgi:hypothetical protein